MWTLAAILLLGVANAGAEVVWPDLSVPARHVGGGAHDSAVVIGIQGYTFVPQVPGAEENAKGWYDYLTRTRGVPAERVRLLLGVDGTREEILDAVRTSAATVGPKGTYWFIFIGHGAPGPDGKDGLLVGVDAQQKASSLSARSVSRSELVLALEKGKAGTINVLLDACFSGRTSDGASIAPGLQPLIAVPSSRAVDPRMTIMTAAKGDQFAGPLPGLGRPAFSYLTLGGVRGWASDKDGKVTAGNLFQYVRGVLDATLRGRNQTPEMQGSETVVVGRSAGEAAPDLREIAKATSGKSGDAFVISALPAVPKLQVPASIQPNTTKGVDWRELDVETLGKYDTVMKFDKSDAAPEAKARKWRELGKTVPKYAEQAARRAAEWDKFAADLAESERARELRVGAMEADWDKLSRLLVMSVIPESDKKRWAMMFVEAYGRKSDENPYVAELQPYVPQGAVEIVIGAAKKPSAKGIEWVTITGGRFSMGSPEGDSDESPVHAVSVPSFQLARSEVTFEQYERCVSAGKCPQLSCSSNDPQIPVFCADWNHADSFSRWVGGRLPSESEWEFAARGPNGNIFPWGNTPPTCALAAMQQYAGYDCRRSEPLRVCSFSAGMTDTGLCDMSGNVWEWVQDAYSESYAQSPLDGSAWEGTSTSDRVIRGGAWDSPANAIRGANRGSAPAVMQSKKNMDIVQKAFSLRLVPGNRIRNIGFRPARSL